MSQLTGRETDVLERLGRAMSNDEIAKDLFLSVNSVKTHLRTLFAKLGVSSRTEAALWLHRSGAQGHDDEQIVGMAKGILMAEGGTDAAGAARVLALASGDAERQRLADELVATYDRSDRYQRPVTLSPRISWALAQCRKGWGPNRAGVVGNPTDAAGTT